ncbi:DUF4382 domain-containing protein [Hymenobacter jeollabukensis]|uniref:DUF4382 domain-containing protein n=1 Tax=Hymenobacter jeollabukensis TaxID=2025313 RepID=A0A5R8WUB0_9BACT|nr:DUF4382 domain-containing protein [Hymenobacter jeollabukensis]TLM95073.1 DUF4382 domain-containing protein [Hymenobacter jeollabukensis]
MKQLTLFSLTALTVLGLAGCGKDNDKSGNAKLQIRLTDAPGDFRAVRLDVQRIELHLNPENDPDGWQTLPFTPQTINVLEYVNGRSALLVDTDFNPGTPQEIRLVLGPNNFVVGRDGNTYALKTPSGQTSGVKLRLQNVTLTAGQTYQLLLDFDVAKSIVERGNGNGNGNQNERYLLKPVIRVVAQDLNGAIRGTVSPTAAAPQVLAIRSSITVPDTFSTMADASGAYQLWSLPAGTYTVKYFPTTSAPAGQNPYLNATRTDVTVTNNAVKTIENVNLQP